MALTTLTQTGLAPDGRRVTISCRCETMQEEWFWHARMTSRTLAIGVSVAAPEYGDDSIERHDYTMRETVHYRSRPLVVAVSPEDDGYLAIWKGPFHCIVFGGAGPVPRLSALTDLLDQFTINDVADGLQMRPQPGSGITMWNMFGAKFTDAGMVTMYPRRDAVGLIPDQPGLQVERGTVWKKTLDNGTGAPGLGKYLHVGADAVAMITDDLGRDPGVTATGQEALLSSLDLRWDQ